MNYEVVVVRSFELDDRNAVVSAIARIAKYLVNKEKSRSLKDDTSWFDRAAASADQFSATPRPAANDEASPDDSGLFTNQD